MSPPRGQFSRPRSPCTNAERLQAARRLRIWRKKYVEEAKTVQDLREEIAQMREAIAQQQTVRTLHMEVTQLRELAAKQTADQERTDTRVKELEEALVKEKKINDALEEVLVRVSQEGVDPTDGESIDKNRMNSIFGLDRHGPASHNDEVMGGDEDWHQLLLDFQPGEFARSDTAERTNFSATPAPIGASMIVSPDTRSRSELLTDIDLMETLKSGTFTKDHGFPQHEHITNYPGHDWEDVNLPPTQAVACDGEPGAWKCTNLHAWGDYYMSGDRSTCSGCSASKTASAEEMDWTLDCGGPRTGFVIFARETY